MRSLHRILADMRNDNARAMDGPLLDVSDPTPYPNRPQHSRTPRDTVYD